jgi:hypothetical protein
MEHFWNTSRTKKFFLVVLGFEPQGLTLARQDTLQLEPCPNLGTIFFILLKLMYKFHYTLYPGLAGSSKTDLACYVTVA